VAKFAVGAACTTNAQCGSGACDCVDAACSSKICHDGACGSCRYATSATTCAQRPTGAACDDGDPCTGGDYCDGAGVCQSGCTCGGGFCAGGFGVDKMDCGTGARDWECDYSNGTPPVCSLITSPCY
jgi:hypothetical protein